MPNKNTRKIQPVNLSSVKNGIVGNDKKKKEESKAPKPKDGNLFSVWNVLLAITAILALAMIAFAIAGIAGFLVVILLFAAVAAGIYSIFIFFAPRDLFFTSVEEGRAKAVMRGTPTGAEFRRTIMSYKGYIIDEDGNVKFVGEEKIKKTLLEEILGGIKWLGIPGIDHIHKYKFKWISMTEKGEIDAKEKILDYIYVKKDIYVEILEGAEVGLTMVPVDIIIFVTAKVINPYKALFRVEKWLEFVINRTKVPLRDYVGGQTGPEKFITEKENLGEFLLDKIKNSGDWEYFRNEIGVEIEKLETPDIDMGKFQEFATKQWKAEQEGKAEVVKQTKEGEAYKAKRLLQKQADMDYLGGVYGKIMEFGNEGLVMRFLDSLTDAAKGPSNTIIPFGFVQDIAKQVLGTKSMGIAEALKETLGKDITKDDIEQFKEFIKAKKQK